MLVKGQQHTVKVLHVRLVQGLDQAVDCQGKVHRGASVVLPLGVHVGDGNVHVTCVCPTPQTAAPSLEKKQTGQP